MQLDIRRCVSGIIKSAYAMIDQSSHPEKESLLSKKTSKKKMNE
jgi:hypothetical protein